MVGPRRSQATDNTDNTDSKTNSKQVAVDPIGVLGVILGPSDRCCPCCPWRLLVPCPPWLYLASGSDRSWNLITLLVVPFPVSMWNGARVLIVVQSPLPFQPALASSMRPSIHFV